MKKVTTIIMIFGLFLVQAQVGINTDTPNATLDIKKNPSLGDAIPQGVLFPRYTTAQRSAFTNVEKGMMIYNTEKECVEICTGNVGGVAQWDCMLGNVNMLNAISTTARISDRTVYIGSLAIGGKTIQGKINNGAEKITLEIPYIQGNGSYDAFTDTQTAAAGHNGDINDLRLDIPAGNFDVHGYLTATIAVEGDGEYLVQQLAPGAEYIIATFDIVLGGATFKVELKGTGGILDRNFANSTSYDFVYMPVEVASPTIVNGKPYKKTWLNLNLGAEYAKVSSNNFNPDVSKFGSDAHGDANTYGSLFQWLRKAEKHEFRNSVTTTTLATSWTASGPWDGKFIKSQVTAYNWLLNVDNSTGVNLQLWGLNGDNNPCPIGYRVPTTQDWADFMDKFRDYKGRLSISEIWLQLALPNLSAAGYRVNSNGIIANVGRGYYTSSTHEAGLLFDREKYPYYSTSGNGMSLRCIKD